MKSVSKALHSSSFAAIHTFFFPASFALLGSCNVWQQLCSFSLGTAKKHTQAYTRVVASFPIYLSCAGSLFLMLSVFASLNQLSFCPSIARRMPWKVSGKLRISLATCALSKYWCFGPFNLVFCLNRKRFI